MPNDDEAKKVFEKGERVTRETIDKGTAAAEETTRQAEQSYSNTAGGIRDFNAKLMETAQANTMAGLEFFRDVSAAKGPAEAFEFLVKAREKPLGTIDSSVPGAFVPWTKSCLIERRSFHAPCTLKQNDCIPIPGSDSSPGVSGQMAQHRTRTKPQRALSAAWP
jgi:hypothetical protein